MIEIQILTPIPEIAEGVLRQSILGRAQNAGLVKLEAIDLRRWTSDRHRTVDDAPYGGGPGMVMKIAPIAAAPEGGREAGHAGADPHAWQSIANARVYIANIRDDLCAADPEGAAVYQSRASAYLARLDGLESDVREAIAAIPPERRKIITTHDAFGYFGAAYGVAFLAPLGVSTDSEASARDVGRIIRQIREQKIPAVFLENVTDPRLSQRIAAESGAKVGGTLYSDGLSAPGGPAGTYIDMVHHNIRELKAALAP